MNNYNPNLHHRRSIHMKGYNYSQSGLYFITICVQDRKSLFGDIIEGKMKLNENDWRYCWGVQIYCNR